MALMFQRLARNYVKNGYFPTDADTLEGILAHLEPASHGPMAILDPCCGEGTALAECKHHLGVDTDDSVFAAGIEYDAERAMQSQQLLDACIQGDIHDCIVGQRSFGLLFLNPPYGDTVTDHAGELRTSEKRQRLEKQFYKLSVPWLAFGGIMVLIIPRYTLDKELSSWIARHFTNVTVFTAPEQRFQQIVVFGRRERGANIGADMRGKVRKHLVDIGSGDVTAPTLTPTCDTPYRVPISQKKPQLEHIKPTPAQYAREIAAIKRIKPSFSDAFRVIRTPRRPVMPLTQWHQALMLSAGEIGGVITSNDGARRFVIKGDTHKSVDVKVEVTENNDGSVSETRIHTDKFVAVIRALDITENSSTFGEVITIS